MPKKNYRSDAGLTVREFIDKYRGGIVRIGCNNGAGFIYAGKIASFMVDAVRSAYGFEIGNLRVMDYYKSYFGGWIMIIPGVINGNADMPAELENPPELEDEPIEFYIRFADAIAGRAAENYKTALIGIVNGSDKARAGYEKDIIEYESFFRSDTFAIICPNCEGNEVIHLIQEQARKELNEIEERRKERKQRSADRPFWHWVH